MISEEFCNHHFVDNVCQNCGIMLNYDLAYTNDYSNNCPKIAIGKNSIIDNLEGIPIEVISRAKANISKKQDYSGKKIRNDAKHTFIEIYSAYLDCGFSDFNPQSLAQKLKLSRKDVNWCLKMTSGTSLISNYLDESFNYASIVILSPIAYIDDICKKNGIEKYIEEIKQLTEDILEKKDILYSSRPEYIACAIVKKFCDKNGISLKCFSKVNKMSDNALKKSISDIKEFF